MLAILILLYVIFNEFQKTYGVWNISLYNSSIVNYNFLGVTCINSSEYLALGSAGSGLKKSIIIRSLNAGKIWNTTFLSSSDSLTDIAAAGNHSLSVSESGNIYYSSDEGSTFRVVTSLSAQLFGIAIGSNRNSFAVGHSVVTDQTQSTATPLIYISKNFVDWKLVFNSSSYIKLNGISSNDGLHAVAVGSGNIILYSFDGGLSWIQSSVVGICKNTDGNLIDLYSVSISPDNITLAGGDSGCLLRSSDLGKSWEKLTTAPNIDYKYHTISSLSSNLAYVTGASSVTSVTSSSIFRTFNGGIGWQADFTTSNTFFNSLNMFNRDIGIAGATYSSDSGSINLYVRSYSSPPHPTSNPSSQPSKQPLRFPTMQPSRQPYSHPSSNPSLIPARRPSRIPSSQPSKQPSHQPLNNPISHPSCQPTSQPIQSPLRLPTTIPTRQPDIRPSVFPTHQPSCQPYKIPTSQPSFQPVKKPTRQPSLNPHPNPSGQPSIRPSHKISTTPTSQPTLQPTLRPVERPSNHPSTQPSKSPVMNPSLQPICFPSMQPSFLPVSKPSMVPTSRPTSIPSGFVPNTPGNWFRQFLITGADLTISYFRSGTWASIQNCIVVGRTIGGSTSKGFIMYSKNNGNVGTWKTSLTSSVALYQDIVSFSNSKLTYCIAVDSIGNVSISTNLGISWPIVIKISNLKLNSLTINNNNGVGWIVGNSLSVSLSFNINVVPRFARVSNR